MQKIINIFHQYKRPKQDLALSRTGIAQTLPGHSYGPAIRQDYIIHIILRGNGVFTANNQRYHLRAGQGFIIFPAEITFYQASQKQPWEYLFFSFSGQKARDYLQEIGFTQKRRVFNVHQLDIFEQLIHQSFHFRHKNIADDLQLTGLLYQLLAQLNQSSTKDIRFLNTKTYLSDCTQKTIQYMGTNFQKSLTIENISHSIGFERSHLTKVFKKDTQMTPKHYLTRLRVDYALDLLSTTDLSVATIANQSGFASTDVFIRSFKHLFATTPKQFQQTQLHNKDLYQTAQPHFSALDLSL
ncbi:AraC family transcriptional regulator [Bombilactobacillus thymidiniphilus]|uniref:AraC family ligand binding domain-containing protein n=1 Tax=Bombilactobacillus thymidiniphilus TaxID=2923363 RepID=A0ABY4PBG0_9LACO|nr:AraC family ligand binding domain-containing protein [Bombilactobacillus thymidiniphilus]UQS83089.1 AraC family ligand binding domain-containing protein [Bombilactobacillus thymidiniphilus]